MSFDPDFPATPAPFAASPHRAPGAVETLVCIVAYFVLQFAFGLLFGTAAGWLAARYPDIAPPAPDRLILIIILTIACAASLIIRVMTWRWGPLTRDAGRLGLGFVPPEGRYVAIGTALGIAAPILGGLLTQWIAGDHEVSQAVSDIAAKAHIGLRIALLPVVVIVGPLVEEVIFRGALLAQLRARMGDHWAIGVSALVFGIVHLPDLGWLWYAVPNLVLVGAFCGWLRVRSGSIWPSFIAHAANNALATVAWFSATT
ncbi:MAG: CPBP family intramembrane metalloprotease [Acidobacteriaceae bacterium]|nr:CPBP family intramembrane metalloprotease [Acidobacteriaceae bacterium]